MTHLTLASRTSYAILGVLGFILMASLVVMPRRDSHDKCDTYGLFPPPHIVCDSLSCENTCDPAGKVTTNAGHQGVACSCVGSTYIPCCIIAYVAATNQYETVGHCAGASCPDETTCEIVSILDESPPYPPVLQWGECLPE